MTRRRACRARPSRAPRRATASCRACRSWPRAGCTRSGRASAWRPSGSRRAGWSTACTRPPPPIAAVAAAGRVIVASSQRGDGAAEVFEPAGGGWTSRYWTPAPAPRWLGALADATHLAWIGFDEDSDPSAPQRLVAGVAAGERSQRGEIAKVAPGDVIRVAPVTDADAVRTTYLLRSVLSDGRQRRAAPSASRCSRSTRSGEPRAGRDSSRGGRVRRSRSARVRRGVSAHRAAASRRAARQQRCQRWQRRGAGWRRAAVAAAAAAAACGGSGGGLGPRRWQRRQRRQRLGALASGGALDQRAGSGSGSGSAAPGAADKCTELPFDKSTPLPEASGAAWLEIDGAPALVVISDSGNDGAYAVIDRVERHREQGKLPLGGQRRPRGHRRARRKLYVLTSPGWVRVYERRGRGFALLDGPYSLGPVDLAGRGSLLGNEPPAGEGMVCAARVLQLRPQLRGLCLAPPGAAGHPAPPAAASASPPPRLTATSTASSIAGRLTVDPLRRDPHLAAGAIAGRLRRRRPTLRRLEHVRPRRRLPRDQLAGSSDREGRVDRRAARRVPRDARRPRRRLLPRMSDTGGAPSAMKKFRCPGR